MCQEGGIVCGFVHYNLTTSDSWLKRMLKTLVDREVRVNSSGCRDMEVGTEANIFRRGFGGRVGMEIPNGAIDKK